MVLHVPHVMTIFVYLHQKRISALIVSDIMSRRIYMYINYNNWDSFHENGPSFIYIKCYKNASRLNRYIFRTVKGINFLFSTLHTIAFVYRKIHFGVLHLLRISTATFDTPPGSNPP